MQLQAFVIVDIPDPAVIATEMQLLVLHPIVVQVLVEHVVVFQAHLRHPKYVVESPIVLAHPVVPVLVVILVV